MAFRSIGQSIQKFNSAASCDLIERYEESLEQRIREDALEPSSRTFAPSSMRCKRKSWFRLRGVEGDLNEHPDLGLEFTARIGTAVHRYIQHDLIDMLKEDWIDVDSYFESANLTKLYKYQIHHDETESQVEIFEPFPIRFAVDGIVKINNQIFLLEIKTSEFNSWQNLSNPKPEHIDQVYTYCAMLHLDKVLMLYVDRMYGGMKCYEVQVPGYVKDDVLDSMQDVLQMAKDSLPPPRLPSGDKWCSPSMCPYFMKCKEWG